MGNLKDLIPDADTLIAMHPADLAGYILETLLSSDALNRGRWNRRNFCMEMGRDFSPSVKDHGLNSGASEACAVAWSWLESNWLICRHPEQGDDWYIPTRRGKELRDKLGVRKLVAGEELPEHFLHSAFVRDVRPLFLQGRYDTAVFEAFKLLEIAVRQKSGLGDSMIGVKLAAKAFNPEDGPLSSIDEEPGERQALMNLMVGAVGSYKNPQSHRQVDLTAPEAREMIMMASHLVKIVESR